MKNPSLLSLDDALQKLLGFAVPITRVIDIPTAEADGYVLATDVISQIQVPSFDNSAMDGYALRIADLSLNAGVLKVGQRIFAGQSATPLLTGEVARIFTGAPIPEGADAVVMQEEVSEIGEDLVRFQSHPNVGQCIRKKGEDIAKDTVLLPKGTRLDPLCLGLIASIGLPSVSVCAKPKVALFSTGDELVMPGDIPPQFLPPGTIFNSNRFFLRTLLERLGCTVTDNGNIPDDPEQTISCLANAAVDHDLILTSGGVSVGEADFVKPAVQKLGELQLWSLSIKPGKPFAYGHVKHPSHPEQRSHFIGLPGNPVSSLVTFLMLVRPFVLFLQSCREPEVRPTLQRADFSFPKADKRREFLRVRCNQRGGLDLFPNQSSGVLTSAVWADGLVDNPPGTTISSGDQVQFLAFKDLMS